MLEINLIYKVCLRFLPKHNLFMSTPDEPKKLNEARYAKALELLANENIPNKEVALQLGFSDESSFHKAFQRWSQKTPAQVRREMNDEK